MTCEQLTLSVNLCRKLMEKGLPQDTMLVWARVPVGVISGGGMYIDKNGCHSIPDTPSGGYADEVMLRSAVNTLHEIICGAPTYGELQEWLLCHDFDNILVKNESADGENAVGISCIHSDGRDFEAHEEMEINALAYIVLEGLE